MEEDPGRVRGQVGPDGQPCAFVHSILIVSSPARRIAAPRRTLWELKNTAQKDGLLQTLLLDNRVGKACSIDDAVGVHSTNLRQD